ncbi:hypothetical protein DB29_00982 [Shouchella clausii]|nr:hypothetical protein DB29_00982 [Shouchella clausii]
MHTQPLHPKHFFPLPFKQTFFLIKRQKATVFLVYSSETTKIN